MWKRVSWQRGAKLLVFEHFDFLCRRFFCRKHVDRCDSVELSQAADAWLLPLQGEVVDELWTDLLPGDYVGVDYVDDKSCEACIVAPVRPECNMDVLPTVMSGLEDLSCVDPKIGPSRARPCERVGLRPGRRRKLLAFQARLVYEPLRIASLRAREQVIQKGGDGVCRLVYVVRSDGSVRILQVFIPDVFREVAPDGARDVERLAARPGAAETVADLTLGDEAELRHGDVAVDGDAAVFKRGCNWQKAMTWRAEDVPGRVEALRSRQRREVPERSSSPHRSDTPRYDDGGIRGRSTAVKGSFGSTID